MSETAKIDADTTIPPDPFKPKDRPNPITVQGMIYNANYCLDQALDHRTHDVPMDLFQKCHGIILISIVEVGFIFTGNVGTGIVMARDIEKNIWSAPSAVGLAGVGFGFLMGAGVKDAIIFIMDKITMGTFARDAQLTIGAQFTNAKFTGGHDVEATAAAGVNKKGASAGGTLSYSFSKGFMIGVSLEGAILAKRDRANKKFYGTKIPILDILKVTDVPADSVTATMSLAEETGIPDLHRKLNRLVEGKKGQPTEKDVAKWEKIRKEADQIAEEMVSKKDQNKVDEEEDEHEDIEFVDSVREAAKEEEKK